MQLLSSGACSEPRGRGSHTAHSVLFPTVLPRPQTRDPAPHANVSLRTGCCSQMGVFLYPWPAHQSSADHDHAPGTAALPPSPAPARDRSGTRHFAAFLPPSLTRVIRQSSNSVVAQSRADRLGLRRRRAEPLQAPLPTSRVTLSPFAHEVKTPPTSSLASFQLAPLISPPTGVSAEPSSFH